MATSAKSAVKEAPSKRIVVSDSLAVKYRPHKIEDMIGNDTAKAALSGMLTRKKFPNTILLHGGTGMGKCVIGSTLVLTSEGMRRIDSLVKHEDGFTKYQGPQVANAYGKWETPAAGFTKIADSTVRVTTKFGTIEGTPEHPMLGIVDGQLGYHRLDSFKINDALATPRIIHHLTCSGSSARNRPNYFLLGVALSSIKLGKGTYKTLHAPEELNDYFVGSNVVIPDAVGADDWCDLAIRQRFPIQSNHPMNTGDLASTQAFPAELYHPMNAYDFLRGVLLANYRGQPNSHVEIVMPTEQLAIEVKMLFMSWNIRSRVSSAVEGSLNRSVFIGEDSSELGTLFDLPQFVTKKSFELNYVGELKLMPEDKLFSHEEKQIRTLQRYSSVTDVQVVNEPKMVYDLSLAGTHSFQTECCISHNTTMARMLARYINCDTGDACGTCSSCRAGDASPDVLEMNMATERGIDEVRNLISKSKLAPRFNKRIFILDELHQCFPGNVQVLLAGGGYKEIEHITVDDRVQGFNHETGQLEDCNVQETHALLNTRSMVRVACDMGHVSCTYDHKWWSEDRQQYVTALHLRKGEKVKTPTGITYVRSVHMARNETTVYDITVPKTSNFFVKVGGECVLVHNCTPQAKEALLKPLEEPAKNTMWILCTTEPEKLTKTILGRCQQINVSAPTSKEMVVHLRQVCRSEGVKVTEERLPVLRHIAEASMGHSRNALQMLETFINLLAGNKEMSIEQIQKLLTSSSGGDNDELAAHLLAAILGGQGKEAVKLLHQAGQNKDTMGVIFKLRWLLDFKLNAWAGTMKFNPHINQIFEKKFGKKPINVTHIIKIMATLVDCEIKIKTVSGLDDRIYFSSRILNDMVEIVSEK